MQILGIDLGSSSIKIAVFDYSKQKTLARAFFPEKELSIEVPNPDWAEQHPDVWWNSLKGALHKIKDQITLKIYKLLASATKCMVWSLLIKI